MADKVLINLATGMEDSERVTVAFLVAGAAHERGREVAGFLTKEAVRQAVPGHAVGVAFAGDTFDTGVCHMAFFADPDGNALMLHHRYAPRESDGQ